MSRGVKNVQDSAVNIGMGPLIGDLETGDDPDPGAGWRRTFALTMGGLMVTFILLIGVGIALIVPGARSWRGPCGREVAPSPRPVIPSSLLDEHEQRNLDLLAAVHVEFGPDRTVGRSFGYQCGGALANDRIVGLTTLVTYPLTEGAARCDVVRELEGILRREGWQVRSLDTPNPSGPGYAGVTDAWREAAYLQASVRPDGTAMTIAIEHTSSQTQMLLQGFPMAPCREDS
jgi:hypothetical protein